MRQTARVRSTHPLGQVSAEGAGECSQGRRPWESGQGSDPSPEGAEEGAFSRPFGALRSQSVGHSRAFGPGCILSPPSGAYAPNRAQFSRAALVGESSRAVMIGLWALLLASIAVAGNTYDIEVSFDPEAKVIQGKMTVSFVNDGSDPVDQVPFRLDLNRTGKDEGWMSVQEVTGADGADLELVYLKDKDAKDLGEFPCAKLPAPLAPGQAVTLEVHFAGGVGAQGTTFWLDDNDRGTTGAAFPRLLSRGGGTEWLRDEWTPADWKVTIVAPEGFHFATSGKKLSDEKRDEGKRDGAMIATTREAKGARGFAVIADPAIAEAVSDAGGVEIRVDSFGEEPEAGRVAALAKEALSALSADLGPYPHASLVFLVTERTRELEVSHGFCVLPKDRLASEESLAASVAYAVAHAWWGDVVGDAGSFPRWLTSGLALHSAERFLSKKLPGVPFRDRWMEAYAQTALLGVDTRIAQPVRTLWGSGFAWDRAISLSKGYSILRLFARRFPSPPMEKRMKLLLAERKGAIASIDDLVAQCPEADRAAAKEFLRVWTMTDYEVSYGITAVETADGKSRVRIARKGNAKGPVDVEGTSPDGKTARGAWDGEAESGEVILDLPVEGLHARIDPDRVLPDIDRSDDDWFPRPKKPPAVGEAAFRRAGKPEKTIAGDTIRWKDRFTLDVKPAAPLDLGLEIEVTDADGARSRTVVLAKRASAGKPIEGTFELAGPVGTQKATVRVFAASSEAEVAYAAKKEKPSWSTQEEFEPGVELGGAKVGPIEWGLRGEKFQLPVTLPGKGAARVWLEIRVSSPGFPELFRYGQSYDVERGKESTLELDGMNPGQQMRAVVEVTLGVLAEGESRPRPEALFWSKRKAIGE